MASPPAPLTEEEKAFFLANGYLKLTNCFTREQAADMIEGVWTRLGMSPTDKSTWTKERTRLPAHRTFDCAAFAPKAWAAICELCGGEDRVDPASREWRDSFIVNLGTAERAGVPVPPRELVEWHVDGDFFVHYLDSPEQALLVTPLFTDVAPQGGGTMICGPAIRDVARHLHAHPEGVSARMAPRAHPDFCRERNREWYVDHARGRADADFVEATGHVGDVYLLHPLMMHSATSNARRDVRIITNPRVSIREPFCFDREDGEYSLVERKTIDAVGGQEMLKCWRITMPREAVVPERLRVEEMMRREELRRLEEGQRVSKQRHMSNNPPSEMLPPELTLIVAATRNMGIGRNGTLPWTGLKKEMAYFARVTKRPEPTNTAATALNAVIMGRKTWDSIPPKFRPLKGRLNIVVSRSHPTSESQTQAAEGPVRVSSLEQALAYLKSASADSAPGVGKAFVIGGAQIYGAALGLPEARRVLLTRILSPDFECDTFFPLELDESHNAENKSGTGSWARKSKEELDAWTGETVPEGVQEENGTKYEFQLWERVD
ncbi:dihydrofolate reductase-like domain-containing protein [Jackrogersella minutella]|nr:dihydrofolate reductase-like domain-containing protein [Jackrogersella minutella]